MKCKKSVLLPMLLAVLSSAVIAVGCGQEGENDKNNGRTAEEPGGGPPVPEEFPIEAFGVVRAPLRQFITLEFPAAIKAVRAERGELLSAGDPILTLDMVEYRMEKERLLSDLKAAELRLEQLRMELDRRDLELEQEYRRLSNQIEVAGAELENLRRRKEQQETLLAQQRDPEIQKLKTELEAARSDYEQALVILEEDEALFEADAIPERENISLQIRQKETVLKNLEIEKEKLNTPAITEVSIQETEVRRIRNQIAAYLKKSDKEWLAGEQIVCPYESGIVEEILVSPGEVVASGTKCASVIDNAALEVEGFVPEEFIVDIEMDGPVEVRPVADPELVVTGRVSSIAALAIQRNNETVVPVTISLDEQGELLLPNFNVDITFNPELQKPGGER